MLIEKAKIVHNNTYDYSKVVYKGSNCKVKIICPEHGEFIQLLNMHVREGQGCPICGRIRAGENISKKQLMSLEKFKSIANKVHDFKYDYSKVVYKGFSKRVEIVCPIHGEFWQFGGASYQ